MAAGQDMTGSSLRSRIALVREIASARQRARELDALRDSTSWRITAPLRKLAAALRGKHDDAPAALPPASGTNAPPLYALLGIAADPGARRMFVDVTEVATQEPGGGVSRVTHQVLLELLSQQQPFAIEPVRLSTAGRYVHARAFLATWMGVPADAFGDDAPIDARAGDVLLGLDLCRAHAAPLGDALEHLRAQGARVALIVHDVLPLAHPEWFPARVPVDFEAWLRVLSAQADLAVCVSRASARALVDALDERALPAPRAGVVAVPLGCDALRDVPRVPMSARSTDAMRVLMVGTVEPRKGHDQALAAIEHLRARGVAAHLVVAGREGWCAPATAARLRRAHARGEATWWEDVDDGLLAALYRDSDVLLMASFGEGFGLPIVEAADAGCRLVLRDLPVFREVGGTAATYFSGDPAAIAGALAARGEHGDMVPRATWRDTADAVVEWCDRIAKGATQVEKKVEEDS